MTNRCGSSPILAKRYNFIYANIVIKEKYSRGRRGAPAKGIGRETGARVQIPPSPFFLTKKVRKNKKVVDKRSKL